MSERDRWSMPDSDLWIYPDLWWEEVGLDVNEERVVGKGSSGASFGFSFLRGRRFPQHSVCCYSNWLCYFSTRSVCLCFFFFCHLLRSERPCLHIELFIRTLRTRSCLFRCLIGICWRLSSSLPANLTYLISPLTSPMKDCHFVQKVKNKIDHHQNILNNIINMAFFFLLTSWYNAMRNCVKTAARIDQEIKDDALLKQMFALIQDAPLIVYFFIPRTVNVYKAPRLLTPPRGEGKHKQPLRETNWKKRNAFAAFHHSEKVEHILCKGTPLWHAVTTFHRLI